MPLETLFDITVSVCCPPPGSVNVRTGKPVEGPGGRWIPCVCAISDKTFVSCVYEVGPGRKQVCSSLPPTNCDDEAFSRAFKLATLAAA